MRVWELQNMIEQEQHSQLSLLVLGLLVVVFSVVTTAVAPQLLYEYFLQNASVDQQILILQYLPAASYVIALLTFIVAVAGFFSSRRRLRLYSQELQLALYSEDCDCGCCEDCYDDNMEEEVLVEEETSVDDLSAALAAVEGKSAKKSSAKKSSKKSK